MTENRTQIVKKQIDNVRTLFERMKPEFAKAMPVAADPQRMLRVALTTIRRNPALLDCTPESLLGAVMESAQLGLELDGNLGHAYLVPFKNKKGQSLVQMIVGYRGLIDLARRSGHVASIEAHVVHEGDTFAFEYGLNPHLVHRPALEKRGKVIAAYALARMVGGGLPVFDVMTAEEIDRIKRKMERGSTSAWATDFEEMARKTPVRRLCKYLPMSAQVLRAASVDEAGESEDGQVFDDFVPDDALDAEIVDAANSLPAKVEGKAEVVGKAADEDSAERAAIQGEGAAKGRQGGLGL